jgi:glutamate-1-semialdehyde 2,1-aminomutase
MSAVESITNKSVFERSLKVIPGGVNSPVRSFREVGVSPMIVKEGKGDTIWDVEGNSYIDFCMSWGALILGHANFEVVESATKQMAKGSSFGIATEEELLLAEEIVSLMPSLEKIRFVSSGTEATMTALRVARGFTKKEIIVKCSGHYHGHHDSLLVQAGSGVSFLPRSSSSGVPADVVKNTLCLPFNDEEAFVELFERSSYKERIAAVIIEPVPANMGVIAPSKTFLQFLRGLTQKWGAVLIFDEVISGFRLGLKGAQGLYGVKPDLTCLGKVIGGGFPAAAFGGKREIMDVLAPLGPVYQAGTLSGNPIAMQAGLTTLQKIRKDPEFYQRLVRKADIITKPVEKAFSKKRSKNSVVQVGSLFSLFFGVQNPRSREDLNGLNLPLFKDLFAFLFQKGVYIPPSNFEAWFVSDAHTEEHLHKTKELLLEFIEKHVE